MDAAHTPTPGGTTAARTTAAGTTAAGTTAGVDARDAASAGRRVLGGTSPVIPEPDPTHTPVIPEPDPTHSPVVPEVPAVPAPAVPGGPGGPGEPEPVPMDPPTPVPGPEPVPEPGPALGGGSGAAVSPEGIEAEARRRGGEAVWRADRDRVTSRLAAEGSGPLNPEDAVVGSPPELPDDRP